jgi:hypothetical protein
MSNQYLELLKSDRWTYILAKTVLKCVGLMPCPILCTAHFEWNYYNSPEEIKEIINTCQKAIAFGANRDAIIEDICCSGLLEIEIMRDPRQHISIRESINSCGSNRNLRGEPEPESLQELKLLFACPLEKIRDDFIKNSTDRDAIEELLVHILSESSRDLGARTEIIAENGLGFGLPWISTTVSASAVDGVEAPSEEAVDTDDWRSRIGEAARASSRSML